MTAPFYLRAAAAAASLAVVLGACQDPLSVEATTPVASGTVAVLALTGTAPNAPSALVLRGVPTVISPEAASAEFDLAVDIDASGNAVFYPVALVDRRATRAVAMQRVDQPYDSVARAPRGTYVGDSSVTLGVGDVAAVRVTIAEACPYSGSPYFYSKIVVDQVSVAARTVVIRATTNPNCGFRSFAPGVPRD